jgi:hypothetical protein
MPAGEAVINPLERLNLGEVKVLIDRLPSIFQLDHSRQPSAAFRGLGIIVNGARRTYYHSYYYAGKSDSSGKQSDGAPVPDQPREESRPPH